MTKKNNNNTNNHKTQSDLKLLEKNIWYSWLNLCEPLREKHLEIKMGEHKKQWGANVYILCLPREVLSAK